MSLAPPLSFGLPEKFQLWRPGQAEALERALFTPKRFSVCGLATGVGKSSLNLAVANFLARPKSAVLTSTKQLQGQYQADFPDLLTDLRGKANYTCKRLDDQDDCGSGPCNEGEPCIYKDIGCSYYSALRAAKQAPRLLTNYSCWLSHPELRTNLLICDEAHRLVEELDMHLAVTLDSALDVPSPAKLARWSDADWRKFCAKASGHLDSWISKESDNSKRLRWRRQSQRLQFLAKNEEERFVWEETGRGILVQPLWPRHHAERLLWRHAERVLCASATVRPKTLQAMGVGPDQYELIEADSPFDPARRPVYVLRSAFMSYRASTTATALWRNRIDQVIASRLDVKGIIHTVSYARARELKEHSEYRELMILHAPSQTERAIREFKRTPHPCILLSPVVHTGVDFPDSDARYQIIAKVPYPDSRKGILKARCESDREYATYLACMQLVQTAGRVVRGERDWGETFIVDDCVFTLLGKYRRFLPRWFLSAVKVVLSVPPQFRA